MARLGSLHQLIVMQIIFGGHFDERRTFTVSDVVKLTEEYFDRAGTYRIIDGLVAKGWLCTKVPTQRKEGSGMPTRYFYERTNKGFEGYRALRSGLAKYNIKLG